MFLDLFQPVIVVLIIVVLAMIVRSNTIRQISQRVYQAPCKEIYRVDPKERDIVLKDADNFPVKDSYVLPKMKRSPELNKRYEEIHELMVREYGQTIRPPQ